MWVRSEKIRLRMYVANNTIAISRLMLSSAFKRSVRGWPAVTQWKTAGISKPIALRAINVALMVAAVRLNF